MPSDDQRLKSSMHICHRIAWWSYQLFSIKWKKLTPIMFLKEFQRVGRGFPWTSSHSASRVKLLYLTSTVGNFRPTLQRINWASVHWIKSNTEIFDDMRRKTTRYANIQNLALSITKKIWQFKCKRNDLSVSIIKFLLAS